MLERILLVFVSDYPGTYSAVRAQVVVISVLPRTAAAAAAGTRPRPRKARKRENKQQQQLLLFQHTNTHTNRLEHELRELAKFGFTQQKSRRTAFPKAEG